MRYDQHLTLHPDCASNTAIPDYIGYFHQRSGSRIRIPGCPIHLPVLLLSIANPVVYHPVSSMQMTIYPSDKNRHYKPTREGRRKWLIEKEKEREFKQWINKLKQLNEEIPT